MVEQGVTEPFAPSGVVWTRVSPKLATARRVILVASLVLPALVVTALAALLSAPLLLIGDVVLIVLGVWVWRSIARLANSWGYAERDDDLLVRKGVVWRRLLVVPYGRMQFVDVEAGPVDRLFGIATVTMHTASAGEDASIPGLPPAEAARLRDRLAARGQARMAGL